jgi:hypothetical protein
MTTDYKTQLQQEIEVADYLQNKFKPVSAKAKEGVFQARPVFLKRYNENPDDDWQFTRVNGSLVAYKVHKPFSPSKGRNGCGFYGITYKIIS